MSKDFVYGFLFCVLLELLFKVATMIINKIEYNKSKKLNGFFFGAKEGNKIFYDYKEFLKHVKESSND
jgi:hypothetical protein